MTTSVSNKNRMYFTIAGILAVGVGAYGLGRVYPPLGPSQGTIGAAQRYVSPQVTQADVTLGDTSVPELMQTDAFELMVHDPSFRALAASPGFQALAAQPQVMAALMADPKAFAALAANPSAFAGVANAALKAASLAPNAHNANAALMGLAGQHSAALQALASHPEAFAAIAARTARIDGKRIGAIAGDLSGVEEMFALKELLAKCGSSNLAVQGGDGFDAKAGRASYIFNPTIAGIDQADALLIIGANPRKEAAILNARIRKRWRGGQLKVGVIGARADLTYDYDYLGAGTDTLGELAGGKGAFLDVLKNASHPIVLIGAGAIARHDGAAVLALAARLAADVGAVKDGWNGFAVLHDTASRVGALDIGFASGMTAAQMATFGTLDVLFLLGADEVKVPDGTFVVYIGTHGDAGAHRADVILPGAAYTEKSAIYVNTEGRVQIAGRASFPPGDAREDWAIIRALSDALGKKLPWDSQSSLRQAIFKVAPHLMRVDQIEAGKADDIKTLAAKGGNVDKAPFKAAVEDFYLTNPIARASAVMAECSRLASGQMLTAAE